MNRRATVGFDRPVHMAWLDAASARCASGGTFAQVRATVWDALEGVVAGADAHGARGKTVTVVAKAWASPTARSAPLRSRAVALLADATPDERLAIQWSIVMATYPFFADVAEAVGRIVAFHDTFQVGQVTRRMVELWGDRTTVVRATPRVVASMLEWGALRRAADSDMYGAVAPRAVGPESGALLIWALLVDGAMTSIPVRSLRSIPALFPFAVGRVEEAIAADPELEVHQQGFGGDVIELRAKRG